MATFKIPQHLPQDLLLISELLGVQREQTPISSSAQDNNCDIASSSSEAESEEEVEKDLTALQDDDDDNDDDGDGNTKPLPSSSGSGSESDSSESESESQLGTKGRITTQREGAEIVNDDEDDPVPTSNAYLQTKNEVADAVITIPEFESVGEDEELEKVGEVLSVIGDVVVVEGLPSGFADRGSERALDSDTLLVFGDRRVMGYICETFGPTSRPLYQIKFNQAYPVNPELIQIGREVFHVPRRSHFVFASQLKHYKGSDASNVYDEEPGDEELEFSDDEAEAAHRSRLKRRRGRERAGTAPSSRHSTPALSQMRDQDMMAEFIAGKSAFDEHGPYDLDYGAFPSRPMPKPYDDPYSDTYQPSKAEVSTSVDAPQMPETGRPASTRNRSFSYSRNRRGPGRGRARADKIRNIRGQGSFNTDYPYTPDNRSPATEAEAYDPRMPQESLPSPYKQHQPNYSFSLTPNANPNSSWVYPSQSFDILQNRQAYMFPGQTYYQAPYAEASAFVQPHINPRFASTFGLQMGFGNEAHGQRPPSSVDQLPEITRGEDWADQWTAPATDHAKEGANP